MNVNDLKATIQALTSEEMSEYWRYYQLISDMERAAPAIWEKRRKLDTRKACRLYFASWLCNRQVTSFKNLTAREIYFIDQWFYGLLGNGYNQDENSILNAQAYAVFCQQHAGQIKELAEQLRKERLNV
jgi:hypothetical protein